MSLNPMSDGRQDFLIKCAEETIGLMNVGVTPNAALTKVAKDKQLNSNEVELVSHSVNNSKTISQLVNADKPEDKEKPFLLTNAKVVNQNLFESQPTVGKTDAALKAESGSKKEAAARSNMEDGYYLDEEPEQHDLAAIFGGAASALPQAKVASLSVADDMTVSISDGDLAVAKLAAVKRAAAEAGEASVEALAAAQVLTTKIGNALRSPGAPNFAEVEKIAAALGAGDEILNDIYAVTKAASFGHRRSTVKVAGILTTTSAVKGLADMILQTESLLKRSNDCSDVKEHLLSEHARVYATLSKSAAGEGDGAEAVNHVSTELGELPDKLTGAAYHNTKAIDLLNSAANTGGEAPEFSAAAPPLGAGARQEGANVAGRLGIEKLMADPYIAHHPVQDVVAAFNSATSTNPNLGEAEMQALVRQNLSSGGAVPLDTLLRVGKGKELPA